MALTVAALAIVTARACAAHRQLIAQIEAGLDPDGLTRAADRPAAHGPACLWACRCDAPPLTRQEREWEAHIDATLAVLSGIHGRTTVLVSVAHCTTHRIPLRGGPTASCPMCRAELDRDLAAFTGGDSQ